MKSEKLSRRDFLRATAVISAGSLLAACVEATPAEPEQPQQEEEAQSAATAPPAEDVTLLFWHQSDEGQPERREATLLMIEKFQEENPGITIEEQAFPHNEYLATILPTAFAGGDPPDILSHVGFQRFLGFSDELLDITDWYTANAQDRYVPGIEAAYELDGHFYGVPWLLGATNFLYFNTEHLERLGFTVEDVQTFADWEEVNQAALAEGLQPFSFAGEGWNCVHWSSIFIDRMIGPERATALFKGEEGKWNDPEMVEAVSIFKDWYDKGYLGEGTVNESWAIALERFFAGETLEGGFVNGITDNIQRVEEEGTAIPIDFIQVPAMADKPGSSGDWVYWSFIFGATKGDHEEAKIAFLDALGSAEYQQLAYQAVKRPPAAKGATEGVADLHWTTRKLQDMYDNANALVPVADLTVTPETAQVMFDELPGVLAGQVSVEEALANIQATAEEA